MNNILRMRIPFAHLEHVCSLLGRNDLEGEAQVGVSEAALHRGEFDIAHPNRVTHRGIPSLIVQLTALFFVCLFFSPWNVATTRQRQGRKKKNEGRKG